MHEPKQTCTNYVKAHLALNKYPRRIRFPEERPKTAAGKIKRFELCNLQQNQII